MARPLCPFYRGGIAAYRCLAQRDLNYRSGLRFGVECEGETDDGPVLAPRVEAVGETPLTPITRHCHTQLATHFGVPQRYYDRMVAEAPELWRNSLNTWRGVDAPANRMLRVLADGSTGARAFMSDRYRRIDDYDVLAAALPAFQELGANVQFESVALTETRMYVKAFMPTVQGEVRKGDVVQAGVMLRNSEVGDGAFEVAPYILRLVCLNGMKVADYGQRRAHAGRRIALDEEAGARFYRADTLEADDRALMLKVRDLVRSACGDEMFRKILDRLHVAANDQRLEIRSASEAGAPVERLAQRFGFAERQKDGVLAHLLAGGDFSAWGLANAVTRQANEEEAYEEATRLEAAGGEVLALDRSQWEEIARAAA